MQNLIGIDVQTTQQLSVSKKLIFSLKILSMNSYELYQFIENETLSNPALLFSNQKDLSHQFHTHDVIASNISNQMEDMFEQISSQIKKLTCNSMKKDFLLDVLENFLDEELYLKKDAFLKKYSSQKYQQWLKYFKRLEPSGLASLHIQERFRHHLEYYGFKHSLAYQIVDECWNFFISKKYDKIAFLLKKNHSEIQIAIRHIQKYCHKNLITKNESPFEQSNSQIFTQADIILKSDDGTITLNQTCLPNIKINQNFIHLLNSARDPQTRKYMVYKIRCVNELILCVQKRSQTLLTIVQTILALQNEHHMNTRRITLKTISTKTNLSQSTISRALKNKTILTSNGIQTIDTFLKSSQNTSKMRGQ